jgi:hypothetical protein
LRQEHRLRVIENRLLRRKFGSKKNGVRGKWRRLHKEELYDVYCSPNITQVKKLKMRCAGHVVRMGERRCAYKILVGRPERRRPLGRPKRRWRIILEWVFKKRDGEYGLDYSGSEQGQVVGSCKCGNERSGSKNCGEFLD